MKKFKPAVLCANCGSTHDGFMYDEPGHEFIAYPTNLEGLDELVEKTNLFLIPFKMMCAPHLCCFEPKDRFIFHTRKRLVDKLYSRIGMDNNPLVNAILEINGVVDLFISPNEIQIAKSPLFEWEEILIEVIARIESYD